MVITKDLEETFTHRERVLPELYVISQNQSGYTQAQDRVVKYSSTGTHSMYYIHPETIE